MPDPMESFHASMEANILAYGVSLVGVFPTEDEPGPSFTYTIGLTDVGWPELIIVGLRSDYAGMILNDICSHYRKCEKAPVRGDILNDVASLPLLLGSVAQHHVHGMLCQAVDRQLRTGGAEPVAVQVIMCDRAGKFPDEPGFDHAYMDPAQPCLAPEGRWDIRRV